MRAAVETVEAEHGAVGVLVNNAGYSQSGAVETLSMDDLRRQFETNVFGLVRMCQLVLPGMRDAGWGRIVNIELDGRRTSRSRAAAPTTRRKYAVEALSDALRFEVKGFGVGVTVHPAGARSARSSPRRSPRSCRRATGPTRPSTPRSAARRATPTRRARSRGSAASPTTSRRRSRRRSPAKRAPIRMRVTPSAHLLITQRRLMPDRAWDGFVATQFKRPRPEGPVPLGARAPGTGPLGLARRPIGDDEAVR